MVNDDVTIASGMDAIVEGPERAERALAISYARVVDRPALAALFALDDALAAVLRTTREPMVGQMRLTWWHDALTRLDLDAAPAEPTLIALQRSVVSRGLRGAELAELIDGWEALIEAETIEKDGILRFSQGRGATLFRLAGRMLGAAERDPVEVAGRGWALADLARHMRDQAAARVAVSLATAPLEEAGRARWSRAARPLGALAHLARMDLRIPLEAPVPTGSPARIGRLLWHRASGR